MAQTKKQTTTGKTIDLAAEELRRLTEEFNAFVADGDVAGLMGMCTDDVSMMWLPVGTFDGKGEVREQWEELFTAFPDFARDTEIIAIDGDTVVSRTIATGTFTGGPFAGYEPTGAAGQVHVIDIVHTKGGKVQRLESYWDGMEMARSLGILPAEGTVADKVARRATNAVTRARHLRKRDRG